MLNHDKKAQFRCCTSREPNQIRIRADTAGLIPTLNFTPAELNSKGKIFAFQ